MQATFSLLIVLQFSHRTLKKSYLLKRGTTCNHPKAPETTSTNHIKCFTENKLFSDCMYLSKYSILKCFLGQMWSQKLKFSKLTEICYRHTLLYLCFEFNVNFSKKNFIHIFCGIFSPKI